MTFKRRGQGSSLPAPMSWPGRLPVPRKAGDP